MKLVHVTFQVQYADAVEAIVGDLDLGHWVRSGRIGGHDRDGRHDGTQAFPGNVTVLQALVPDDRVDEVIDDLEAFRREKSAHRHLVAAVLAVERAVGLDATDEPEDGP